MSDAETLRRAVALMRERAEGATPGRWEVLQTDYADDAGVCNPGGELVVEHDQSSLTDATHIASWHPAVALAVADLLTVISWFPSSADPTDIKVALAVAHAYLQESP